MRLTAANLHVGSLVENRYFLAGIALQKGAPIFVLPLAVAAIGSVEYAKFILLYTIVQVAAVVGSLSLANALTPFWFQQLEGGRLLGSFVAILVMVQLGLAIPIAFVIFYVLDSVLGIGPWTFTAAILAFSFIHNLNSLALNVVRMKAEQRTFFWTTVFSLAILVLLVWPLKSIEGPKLLWFTLIQSFVLALQTGLYLTGSRVLPLTFGVRSEDLLSLARALLRFSLPLTFYTLVTLAALVLDKWIVRGFFDSLFLAQYVVDMQFAFSIAVISLAIGMYNTKRLAELVHRRDAWGVRSNILGIYGLSAASSILAALAAFVYAWAGGVTLSWGFWALAAAFTMNNCYAVNSHLITLKKRSGALAGIALASTCLFCGLLLLAGFLASTRLVYFSFLIYQATMLALSFSLVSWEFESNAAARSVISAPVVIQD